MQVIQIHILRAQALERLLERFAHVLRSAVDVQWAGGVPPDTELRSEEDFAAPAGLGEPFTECEFRCGEVLSVSYTIRGNTN